MRTRSLPLLMGMLLFLVVLSPVAALAQVGDQPGSVSTTTGSGAEIAWILGALVVGVVIGFGIAIGARDLRMGARESRGGRSSSVEEYMEQQREVVNRW